MMMTKAAADAIEAARIRTIQELLNTYEDLRTYYSPAECRAIMTEVASLAPKPIQLKKKKKK